MKKEKRRMKVAGFTDSTKFSARVLHPMAMSEAVAAKMLAHALAQNPDDKAAAKIALLEALSDEDKAAFRNLGVELPDDLVTVNIDFGVFLFDCYRLGYPEPSAPLRKLAYFSVMQNTATRWEKEPLLITKEELACIKKAVDTEELWLQGNFAAYVLVDGKQVPLGFKPDAMKFFGKLFEAVTKLFDEPALEAVPDAP